MDGILYGCCCEPCIRRSEHAKDRLHFRIRLCERYRVLLLRFRALRQAKAGQPPGNKVRRHILKSGALALLPLAISPASHAWSGPGVCSNLGHYVSVGGTAGFNTLVDPDFTAALLATGHVRLYEHATAIGAAISDSPPSNPYAILNDIENVFSGTGPGEAELGLLGSNYFTLPAGSYSGYYQYQYVNSGLNPSAANVDVPYKPASAIKFDRKNVEAWKAWVQAGRSVGIASMAPIVAPNAAWKPNSPIYPPTRREYYDLDS